MKKVGKLRANAMKRLAANAHLPIHRFFFRLPEAKTIEQITPWAAVSSPSANIRYSFFTVEELGRALQPKLLGGKW